MDCPAYQNGGLMIFNRFGELFCRVWDDIFWVSTIKLWNSISTILDIVKRIFRDKNWSEIKMPLFLFLNILKKNRHFKIEKSMGKS